MYRALGRAQAEKQQVLSVYEVQLTLCPLISLYRLKIALALASALRLHPLIGCLVSAFQPHWIMLLRLFPDAG